MFEISTHSSIAEIGQQRWEQLNSEAYPFTRYAFLHALETTGSVSPETGWQPLHVEVRRDGETVLLMPLYLKQHSWGEYVFDWSWAEAYERAGRNYYPKLLGAIPFTPATGPRWFSSLNEEQIEPLIAQILSQLCEEYRIETAHILFPHTSDNPFKGTRMMQRMGCQYHWFNQGFKDFDDYLASFNARKRKDLKKERRKVAEQGIEFEQLTGGAINAQVIETFYDFYVMTYLVRGQQPYLTKAFFLELSNTLADQMLLVMARYEGEYVAGALSFFDDSTLYGRYWGCTQEFDGLHFETCYYQGLDHCIAKGLTRFDPGAQGEHKIKRGFVPTPTYSYHHVKDPQFNLAIERFLDEEKRAMEHRMLQLQEHLPFRKEG